MKVLTFLDRQWMRYNPKKRARLHESAQIPTHPLFLENQDVALLWSAKSGCTLAVKWFFLQRNELDKAQDYSSWIHDYRIDVYRKSAEFEAGVHRAEYGKMRYIRFVRNPFSRAVSSYLHMVRTVGDDTFHQPFNTFLGRDIETGAGATFREFVDFLSQVDVSQCDIHYRQQVHALEVDNLIDVDHVVHLEDVDNELQSVTEYYGLKPASIDSLSSSSHNTTRSASGISFVGDVPHVRTDADVYPDYRDFYDFDLVGRVAKIYAQDFERYKYSTLL